MRETVKTDGTVTLVLDFIYDESGKPFAMDNQREFILEPVKKLEKLFIAPKTRQILHETAQRATHVASVRSTRDS